MTALVGPGLAGALVGASGFSATVVAAIANGGGNGFTKNLTGAYSAPASEAGYTYTNHGAAGGVVITLPLTPRLGTVYSFICDAAQTNFMAFNAGAGATIKSTSGSSTVGGNVVTAGSNTVCVTVRYEDVNTWAVVASNGVAVTNYTLN